MDPALRLQSGQHELTPAQQAEARRFADVYIQQQLSTEPVDEQEAEAWLRQAYALAGLAPPRHIYWLDGLFQLCVVLSPPPTEDSPWHDIRATLFSSARVSVWDRIKASIKASIKANIGNAAWASLQVTVKDRIRISVWDRVGARTGSDLALFEEHDTWDLVSAYKQAPWLALSHYFAVSMAPNDFQAMARFNALVSGYWLGKEVALILRRPKVLALDAAGRLHHATDACLVFHDGWDYYAWHGMWVPQKVIAAPETLTREDFVGQWNVEVL